MCYTAPGPRCSTYARKILEKAHAQANRPDATYEDHEQYLKAREDWYMTPEGLAHLKKQLDEADGSQYLNRKRDYDFYCDKRRDSLAVIKLPFNTKADIDHRHEPLPEEVEAEKAAEAARLAAPPVYSTDAKGNVTVEDKFDSDKSLTLSKKGTVAIRGYREYREVELDEQEMERLSAIAANMQEGWDYELDTKEDGIIVKVEPHWDDKELLTLSIRNEYESNPYNFPPSIEVPRKAVAKMAEDVSPQYA